MYRHLMDAVMQCKARSKRSGEQCQKDAMVGAEVCHIHGGRSRKGIASPTFKHGKHSAYMPRGLLDTYQATLNDPEATHMREEIAVLKTYEAKLIKELGESQAPVLWRRLKEERVKLRKAQARNDNDASSGHLAEIYALIDRGADEAEKWREIIALAGEIGKMKERETKRKLQEQQVVTLDEAAGFYLELATTLKKHIKDRRLLETIVNDITPIGGRTTRAIS